MKGVAQHAVLGTDPRWMEYPDYILPLVINCHLWVAKGRSCAPKILAARGKGIRLGVFKFTPYIERAFVFIHRRV